MYEKSKSAKLDMDLFENPTAEYRATPFWAWNCELNKQELLTQIEELKRMGFGGFHIHCRSGMATQYLGSEFMGLVKDCVQKAEEEQMYTYLYDEDRWPSGFAGGYVTKKRKNRQRGILLTANKRTDVTTFARAVEEGLNAFVAAFDVNLNTNGELISYTRIGEDDEAKGLKRYVYFCTAEDSDFFNGQSYLDSLSYQPVKDFINITHETYKREVGTKFGATIPSIFCDEPQQLRKIPLATPLSEGIAQLPWCPTFAEEFLAKYGYDIVDKLPELFWGNQGGTVSKARYDYHDFSCELFTRNFIGTYGQWCEENGIAMTGHLMEEDSLYRQARCVGETMRAYKYFTVPGIDMLCNEKNFNTAKQAQSIARQYGKAGVMAELYGVTDWDFDFRGHKFQGDWLSALGVTLRVPHLSWVSMKGPSKRDYPATFNYQTPWYKEYSFVENHFARLGTVLTRGKPLVKVAVVHPIESMWLYMTTEEGGYSARKRLDSRFETLTKWLLGGHIDFDFLCESLLPEQYTDTEKGLQVGEMNYDTVIVPALETMRKSTLDILSAFAEKGGRVLVLEKAPQYIDALLSLDGQRLLEKGTCIPFDEWSLIEHLERDRLVGIKNATGTVAEDLIYTLRQDGDIHWLFIAHCERGGGKAFTDIPVCNRIVCTLKGKFTPVLYDTLTGKTEDIPFTYQDGNTVFERGVYESDSLLIALYAPSEPQQGKVINTRVLSGERIKNTVPYTWEDGNVLLLDEADYRLDDGEWCETEEVLRIAKYARQACGYPNGNRQPWVMRVGKATHTITLRFTFESEIEIDGCRLATEVLDVADIRFNGEKIDGTPCGYFRDRSIQTTILPRLKQGENVIEVRMPFGERDFVEAMYILGDFGVRLAGMEKTVVQQPRKIGFGDLTVQGLPFFGSNITYKTQYVAEKACRVRITVNSYRGACVKVYVDGAFLGVIAFAPYALETELSAGAHTIDYVLCGTLVNTFGSLHNVNEADVWSGPERWHTQGLGFRYEYALKRTGILSSPVIEVIEVV